MEHGFCCAICPAENASAAHPSAADEWETFPRVFSRSLFRANGPGISFTSGFRLQRQQEAPKLHNEPTRLDLKRERYRAVQLKSYTQRPRIRGRESKRARERAGSRASALTKRQCSFRDCAKPELLTSEAPREFDHALSLSLLCLYPALSQNFPLSPSL